MEENCAETGLGFTLQFSMKGTSKRLYPGALIPLEIQCAEFMVILSLAAGGRDGECEPSSDC